MGRMVRVTIETQAGHVPGKSPQSLLKLQTDTWEINVRARLGELVRLRDVRHADWNSRGSLAIGQSAGASVYWASSGQDDQVVILVGHDDETWDLAFTVPATADLIGDES
jgi:hypothetical protein